MVCNTLLYSMKRTYVGSEVTYLMERSNFRVERSNFRVERSNFRVVRSNRIPVVSTRIKVWNLVCLIVQYLEHFVTMRTSKHRPQELNINLTSYTFIMGVTLLPHRYRIDLIHTVQDGSVVNCYPHFTFDRITLCHIFAAIVWFHHATPYLSLGGKRCCITRQNNGCKGDSMHLYS